jgi:uroporphyrinogen decarboxylase
MDSDGDVTELIPLWLECGINLISPLEVAAGMDVVQLRQQYGRQLLMAGGFDKRILAAGKDAIQAELKRLWPVIQEGGYIPTCDHGWPHDISFENACCFMNTLKAMYGMK